MLSLKFGDPLSLFVSFSLSSFVKHFQSIAFLLGFCKCRFLPYDMKGWNLFSQLVLYLNFCIWYKPLSQPFSFLYKPHLILSFSAHFGFLGENTNMLDGLLKPKFYNKWFDKNPILFALFSCCLCKFWTFVSFFIFLDCWVCFNLSYFDFHFWFFLFSFFFWYSKSNLKLLKVRLEGIKKKKNAVQKYLKSDIVDLLRNNLDINAYGRVSFSIICFSLYEIQYLFFPSFSMILWPCLVFFFFFFWKSFS